LIGQCFYCKKIRHRKFECRKFKNEKKGQTRKPSTYHTNTRSKHADKEEDKTDDAILLVHAHIDEKDKQIWLADSGASYHMAHDKSIFQNMRKAEMSHIKLGDERCVSVIGKRDVKKDVKGCKKM
jgi:hypothetical protein